MEDDLKKATQLKTELQYLYEKARELELERDEHQ